MTGSILTTRLPRRLWGCGTRPDLPGLPTDGIRLDKWLWHARFFKTRTRATELVASGKVRVNGRHARKPGTLVRRGDTLTFPQGRDIRVVRIVSLSQRRGPAVEAQALYDDLRSDRTGDD
ncbi:MAG: S4 domain-containing protein [Pseudomonadota bacterium]